MERINQSTLDQILKSKNQGVRIALCFEAMTSYCTEKVHVEGEDTKFYVVAHLLSSVVCHGISVKVADFLKKFENQIPQLAGMLLCEKMAKMEGVHTENFN